MAKTCQICGKPSGMYPLCPACFKLRDEGKIEKCEDCGAWHRTECSCECKKTTKSTTAEPTKEKKETDELTCIVCNKPCKGKHFCFDCYKKYNKKIVYIKVKNCKEFDPLGTEYESDLICEDGHIVKSEPERNIDNWLFNHDIKHIYEKTYQVSETIKLRPDWCLPGYIQDENGHPVDVYVEYWGIEGSAKYENIKNFKLPIYQQERLTLVNINAEQDKRDISAALDWKIGQKKKIKPYEINFLNI